MKFRVQVGGPLAHAKIVSALSLNLGTWAWQIWLRKWKITWDQTQCQPQLLPPRWVWACLRREWTHLPPFSSHDHSDLDNNMTELRQTFILNLIPAAPVLCPARLKYTWFARLTGVALVTIASNLKSKVSQQFWWLWVAQSCKQKMAQFSNRRRTPLTLNGEDFLLL